jgi:hypothetical protein
VSARTPEERARDLIVADNRRDCPADCRTVHATVCPACLGRDIAAAIREAADTPEIRAALALADEVDKANAKVGGYVWEPFYAALAAYRAAKGAR